MQPLRSTRQRRDLMPRGFVLCSVRAVIPLSLRSVSDREPDLKRTYSPVHKMVVHSVARELPSRPGTPSRLRAPALLGSSLSTGNLTLTRIQTAPAEIPNMHELKSIMGSLPRGSSLQLHPFDASYGATTRHHHANGAFYYRTGYDDLRCSLLRSVSLLAYWADGPCTLVAGDHVKASSH